MLRPSLKRAQHADAPTARLTACFENRARRSILIGVRRWLVGVVALCLVLTACGGESAEQSRILFLRGAPTQLFVHNLETGEEQQLTNAAEGVFSYVASGEQAITVQDRADGGADLWLVDVNGGESEQILDCADVRCDQPFWSADGRRVVYVRRSLLGEEPRVYWLDSATGDTVPVFTDNELFGYAPRLSADDRYLSFVTQPPASELLPPGHSPSDGHDHSLQLNTQRVTLYDFETGKQIVVPNRMSSAATWQPDSTKLLVTDLQLFGERLGIHLLLIDAESGEVDDISEVRLVEDGTPDWSADGDQLVFTRALASTAMGRQLWTMSPDGSGQQQLTNDANIHHGQPTWSADGSRILLQTFDTTRSDVPPQIVIYDVETGEMRPIVEGNRPSWVE